MTVPLTLMACLVVPLAGPLRAAPLPALPQPETGPSKEASAPVVSVSSPAVSISTGPWTAQEVVEAVRRLDEKLHGVQASFRQTLKTQAGLTQDQTGRLFYLKPDRIRMEFDSPRKQVTVSDRKLLWVHQIEEKQVIRADWEEWKKGQSQLTGLLEFGRYASILDRHAATLAPYAAEGSTSPSTAWKLTLKPKASASYTLSLVVAPPDWFPTRAELALGGLEVVNELDEVRFNPELDPALFEFKPPPGLPVIDLSGPPAP